MLREVRAAFVGFLPPPPNEVLRALNCLCPRLARSAMLTSLCVAKNLPRNNSYMCSQVRTDPTGNDFTI